MRVRVGTSGYSYKEWKGAFYPEDLPDREMLRFYGERFDTVEVNNSFYRIPKKEVLAKWHAEVPAGFLFVLKASQRITHHARLKETGADTVSYFLDVATALGDKLGPILFQLPPNLKKDVPRLEGFLARLPATVRAAFEFRHESWMADDVMAALSERGAALCTADADDAPEALGRVVATTDWGYLRLRGLGYGDADLDAWAERITKQSWQETFVFFKHEDEGKGAALATELVRRLAGGTDA